MNKESENSERMYAIIAFIALVVLGFLSRLLYLQIFSDGYELASQKNAIFKDVYYPQRGTIYDRNGEALVCNQPSFDLMVILKGIPTFDTSSFCQAVNLTKEQIINRFLEIKDRRRNPGYSPYTPQVFLTRMSPKECAVLQEKIHSFPGFYIRKRAERQYTTPYAALVLGSTGEVSKKEVQDGYYISGDYIGRLGVEEFYEEQLRGKKGSMKYLRDAYGRIVGRYKEGAEDVMPEAGKDLYTSLDINLQAYGEHLMKGKIGSIIAIEPSTGEVLAMVASPTYDPSLLVGRQRGKHYMELLKDKNKPLYNRSIMAIYPPGSTFKVAQSLVLQQEGIITYRTCYGCSRGFYYGAFHLGCHSHGSPLNLVLSIANSCNAYYCAGLRDMLCNRRKYTSFADAMDSWKELMNAQGFGNRLGIDLPSEKNGFIPSSQFYDKKYGKGRWNPYTILSISIGQGEIITTPLQIANLAATVANRGWFITPHLVKKVEDMELDTLYTKRRYTGIDSSYYTYAVQGMTLAVEGGTLHGGKIPGITMAGKTGTAENPHGKDHSICMVFAPVDTPKIAIAVYIENAGFGATYAVPTASLMVEKYLRGEISPSRQWMEDRLVNTEITPEGIRSHSPVKENMISSEGDHIVSKNTTHSISTNSEPKEQKEVEVIPLSE